MNMLERIEILMKQKSVNKRQLAVQTKIPPTTVYGWWDKGFEGMTLPTLKKLASFFGCSMEYLVNGNTEVDESDLDPSWNKEENELIDIYHSLSSAGKYLLLQTARSFAGNPGMKEEEHGSSAM